MGRQPVLIKSETQGVYVNTAYITGLYVQEVTEGGTPIAQVMAMRGSAEDPVSDTPLMSISNADSVAAVTEAKNAMDAIASAIGCLNITALQAIPAS